jgi:hypothetical protein
LLAGSRWRGALDLSQWSFRISAAHGGTKPPEKRGPRKDEPKPARVEEAKQIVEQYPAALREIIEKLRGKMN